MIPDRHQGSFFNPPSGPTRQRGRVSLLICAGMCAWPDRYIEMKNNSNWLRDFVKSMNSCSQKGKERHMAIGLSVVGGLLLAGYAFSRLRARKGAKKDVLKLFS